MKILVDADACPVVHETEAVAQKYEIPVVLFCDTNHILRSDYAEVRVIGAGADAVDLALINSCKSGDIVITQDYGVAALALGKKAYAMHQNGWQYTDRNIDKLLAERHMAKRIRRSSRRNHLHGPKKRTEENNAMFAVALEALIISTKG